MNIWSIQRRGCRPFSREAPTWIRGLSDGAGTASSPETAKPEHLSTRGRPQRLTGGEPTRQTLEWKRCFSVARGSWEGREKKRKRPSAAERGPHFINVLMATCILIENNQIKPPLQTDIWRWALYLRGPRRGAKLPRAQIRRRRLNCMLSPP